MRMNEGMRMDTELWAVMRGQATTHALVGTPHEHQISIETQLVDINQN